MPIVSPRLSALQVAMRADHRVALDEFWRELEVLGAPLVESIPDDDDYRLVTFIWRAGQPTNQVAIIRDWGGANRLADQWQMQQLLGSDLWFVSRRLKADTRMLYQVSLNDPRVPWTISTERTTTASGWQLDPLNHHRQLVIREDEERGSRDLYFSKLELPDAPPQPYLTHRPEVPAGTVQCQRLQSTVLGNERRVWVYLPPLYSASNASAYALLVIFDGKEYVDLIPTPTILDNLLAERHIPPVIAIFPDSLGWEIRGKELPCYPPFLDFITQELLPWAQSRFMITTDPARTVVAGSSYGGLAAAYVGLHLSHRFGCVLSQTGAFGWSARPDEEPEWLAHQFAQQACRPLRFYLEVGNLETEQPVEGGPSQLTANRHLRNVLKAKGYSVHYTEYSGGHDYLNLQGTLASGLIALLGASPMDQSNPTPVVEAGQITSC